MASRPSSAGAAWFHERQSPNHVPWQIVRLGPAGRRPEVRLAAAAVAAAVTAAASYAPWPTLPANARADVDISGRPASDRRRCSAGEDAQGGPAQTSRGGRTRRPRQCARHRATPRSWLDLASGLPVASSSEQTSSCTVEARARLPDLSRRSDRRRVSGGLVSLRRAAFAPSAAVPGTRLRYAGRCAVAAAIRTPHDSGRARSPPLTPASPLVARRQRARARRAHVRAVGRPRQSRARPLPPAAASASTKSDVGRTDVAPSVAARSWTPRRPNNFAAAVVRERVYTSSRACSHCVNPHRGMQQIHLCCAHPRAYMDSA
eukprot:355843-Chlamydomonas_euryale.AAC.3